MKNGLLSASGNIPKLNAIRIIIVLVIAFGYTSTMPLGPDKAEIFQFFGYDPSWIGIQLLFFLSGCLALRSFDRHRSSRLFLTSRILRTGPLLVLYTLITVLIIYPLLGTPGNNFATEIKKLSLYFSTTILCIHPGQPLPGLLDHAKYTCLIQGAIWTLRWGFIAYIATALCHIFGVLKNRPLILFLALMAIFLYFTVKMIEVAYSLQGLETPLTGLRLGYIYLLGMATYTYQDKIPQRLLTRLAIVLTLAAIMTLCYFFAPWTPAIEICLTLFWAYLAFFVITAKRSDLAFLNHWPNMVLPLYLTNWPVAQLLLLAFPNIGVWSLIGLSLPLSTIIAYAVFKLISEPGYNQIARIQHRRWAKTG